MAHDLEQKAANAIRQVIIDAETDIPDAQIYTDFNSQLETQTLPCVSITCAGGDEDGHNSGNFRLSFSVTVKGQSSATDADDDTRADHAELVAAVLDALYDDALHTSLTDAVEDFTVFNSITRDRSGNTVDGRKFETSVILEFSCCPSDIA